MSKIGFYGGCFNPPTNAHIVFAKTSIEKYNLDKVVFVPVNSNYGKDSLADEKHRYNMLKILCIQNHKFEVSDMEFKIKKKLFAIDTFKIINDSYRNDDIYFLMGSDNLNTLPSWKCSEQLIRNFKYIILERDQFISEDIINNNDLLFSNKYRFNLMKTNLNTNISSSIVRDKIKNNDNITSLIPERIKEYIYQNDIYVN